MSPALRRYAGRLLAIAVLIALILLLRELPIVDWLEQANRWVAVNPWRGAALYIAATTLAGIAATPGWIPMMLAGLLFGLEAGLPLAVLGILCGATAAFLTGRTLLRGWVERRIADNRRLRAIDRALGDRAFTIVLLTRLALLIPYNVLNYAYGLTRVRLGTYMAATVVGMLPIISMYVYMGTLARDIGQILDGEHTGGAPRWWLGVIALIAIVAVTVVINRAASRALAEQMDEPKDPPPANGG